MNIEIYIVIYVVLSSLYTVFAVFRDISTLRLNKSYRKVWVDGSRHIQELLLDVEQLKYVVHFLQNPEPKKESER